MGYRTVKTGWDATPHDRAFWEGCDVVRVDWHEELRYRWWSGTVLARWGKELYEVRVQGDPKGDVWSYHEVVEGWEVVDVFD
jgi:hypothetical protein